MERMYDVAVVGLGVAGAATAAELAGRGARVVGLDRFRPEDRPPVAIPFVAYHLMIAAGIGFIALTTLACVLLRGGRLFRTRWLLAVFVAAVVPAVIANQAGWVAAEVGRQPWIVHPPVEWTAAGELVTGPDGRVAWPA